MSALKWRTFMFFIPKMPGKNSPDFFLLSENQKEAKY
jgi:hypothetical protein